MNLRSTSKWKWSLWALSTALVTSASADDAPIPPRPPAFYSPPLFTALHSDQPAVIEPGLPPRSGPRGAAPGALIENGENGENGAGNVEDHSGAGYVLLQDSVAGQGDYAF